MKSIASVFPRRGKALNRPGPDDKAKTPLELPALLRLIFPHIIAFLLGRLVLADDLAPFGPAFYSVYRSYGGFLTPLCGILVVLGSLTLGKPTIAIYSAVTIGILTLVAKPVRQRVQYRFLDAFIPGIAIFGVRVMLILFGRQTLLLYISAFLEAIVGGIAAFLFQSSLPYGETEKDGRSLASETRVYSWVIIAVLMLGSLNGIGAWGISLDMLFALGGCLVMGYAGGSGYGALFGLLSGTVIALTGSQGVVVISHLGTAGALAGIGGLFGKIEAITGYLSSGLIMSFMEGSGAEISERLITQILSIPFLFLLPAAIFETISCVFKHRPVNFGRQGRDTSREDMEKGLSGKVASLSAALSEVAMLFAEVSAADLGQERQKTYMKESSLVLGESSDLEDEFKGTSAFNDEAFGKESYKELIKEIAGRTCRDCPSQKSCWEEEFGSTYEAFTNLTRKIQVTGRIKPQDLIELYDKCSRAGEIAAEINHKEEIDRLNRKLGLLHRETRECLFHQYRSLSQMLNYTLTLSAKKRDTVTSDEDYVDRARQKASRFKLSIKGKTVTAGDQEKSGDMWVRYDLAPGKILVALADGMGKGPEAARQSEETIGILKLLLDAGVDYDSCISFLNSGLYLAWRPERFLALDFVLLDLNLERAFFHKMGAPPSFIRRKDGNVVVVRGSTPPVGSTKSLVSLASSEPILPGDLLILVSDGVFRSSPIPSRAEHMLVMRLSRLKDVSLDSCIRTIVSQSIRYPGQKPPDDVTAVIIEISQV